MTKLIVFVVVSVPVLWFSWPFLRDRTKHGFYRFFAFECLIVLLLLNIDYWFVDPLSFPQIIAWILLISSGILAIHGFTLLRRIGRPRGDFENTTQLVVVGVYKYIRHPLYASLLYLGWGIYFKHISLEGGALALAVSFLLIGTAKTEEQENVAKFGAAYEGYMKETRMFIPFLF
ncbi:MAG TPA: isoprenylcysteine carboxylmethyltransferase family protein [Bacteroidota bacterium]|nr:isoprenylcysteine carboxylmethyltransferase family protein [Bacteroidota bacterium]